MSPVCSQCGSGGGVSASLVILTAASHHLIPVPFRLNNQATSNGVTRTLRVYGTMSLLLLLLMPGCGVTMHHVTERRYQQAPAQAANSTASFALDARSYSSVL